MSDQQQTLAKEVSMQGVGIHTGQPVSVRVLPAPAGTGIVFIRTDLPNRPTIPVNSGQVVDEGHSIRRTTLSKDGVQIQTVEHIMAALWGTGIDNACIEVTASEMPGLDGSAAPFVRQFKAAGTVEQAAPRRFFALREPILVEEGASYIAVFPDRSLSVSYLLDYDHPGLRSQCVSYTLNGASFEETIAPARTFCLKQEAEALRAAGFGKGASYDNTLVWGDNGVIKNTLRFPDECARHKLLDLLGDLYLIGAHLRGRVIAMKSGHALNVRLIKKLHQALEQARSSAPASASAEASEGSQLDVIQIQKILPHRDPFLFVDRIIELTDTRAVGIKNVTINDYFFRGHFPGKPVMPGVLIVEAMAQVGGIILLHKAEHRGKIPYFMAVDKVKFRKPVVPGDQLVLQAELGKLRSRTGQLMGRALVDGKVVCEGELMFALMDA